MKNFRPAWGRPRFPRRASGENLIQTIDGRELNLALVENGLAWHFKKYSSDPRFTNAENAAKSAKIGLWSEPNPTPPWEWRKSK